MASSRLCHAPSRTVGALYVMQFMDALNLGIDAAVSNRRTPRGEQFAGKASVIGPDRSCLPLRRAAC
ncbi:hypothetical protein D1223_17490 [Henriciella mobilis]|uniref:Uncharacterized protein n=1 Tax=Henriciella mobilis TaxID=2305467 RepID=A0A399R9V5_9PROT|nr:hypothetical protein D1223_17490 [Henriciella mobilis]